MELYVQKNRSGSAKTSVEKETAADSFEFTCSEDSGSRYTKIANLSLEFLSYTYARKISLTLKPSLINKVCYIPVILIYYLVHMSCHKQSLGIHFFYSSKQIIKANSILNFENN